LPSGVSIAAVEDVIATAAGSLLESVRVIDEYRGKGLPPGRRSVAVRLVFRGRERTLRDADVEAVLSGVLTKLGQALDVTLRTA
jgi:phenylalanyl-tRNA synthetase beta chain